MLYQHQCSYSQHSPLSSHIAINEYLRSSVVGRRPIEGTVRMGVFLVSKATAALKPKWQSKGCLVAVVLCDATHNTRAIIDWCRRCLAGHRTIAAFVKSKVL